MKLHALTDLRVLAEPPAPIAPPAPARSIIATPRFLDDHAEYCGKYPTFAPAAQRFINHRRDSRSDQRVREGDGMLPVQLIRNTWRMHLVPGKAIMLYQLMTTELRLLAVVNSDVINRGLTPIANYVTTLSSRNLIQYDPNKLPEPKQPKHPKQPKQPHDPSIKQELSSLHKDQLILLFKMLASEPADRDILVAAAIGNIDDLLKEACDAVNVSPKNPGIVMSALGGRAGIIQWAKAWLKSTQRTQPVVTTA